MLNRLIVFCATKDKDEVREKMNRAIEEAKEATKNALVEEASSPSFRACYRPGGEVETLLFAGKTSILCSFPIPYFPYTNRHSISSSHTR